MSLMRKLFMSLVLVFFSERLYIQLFLGLVVSQMFLLLQLRLRCRSNNSPGLFSSRDHQDHVLSYDDELLLNFLSLSSYKHQCNHNGFNLYGLGTNLFRFHLLWRHNQHKHQSHMGSSCTLRHYSYHSVFSTLWKPHVIP